MPTLSRNDMKKIVYLRNAVVDLLDHLQTRKETLTAKGTFRKSGVKKQVSLAFKKIIKGEKASSVPAEDIHFAISLLKKILAELRALKQPVIYQTSDKTNNERVTLTDNSDYNNDWTKTLPIFNYQLICKLHTLMNKIYMNSDDNMMTIKSISDSLSQILFLQNATKRNDLFIENFIKSPTPQPLAPACFKKMIQNITTEIRTKTWNTRFAGGVRIDIAGQFKKVPQHVAEIYEIISCSQLGPEDKYNQIKEQAEKAIFKPQLWQKKDTFEFYKKVVNDEYFPSSTHA